MSGQPLRITRRPSAAEPAPANPCPDLPACPKCGAWVADERLHAEFHDSFVSAERWMRRMSEVLHQVIREDLPAYDDLVPKPGDIQPASIDTQETRRHA
ncbi:hypothetical protein [Nocardia sp. SC052]|uniref:hypothetical protein n=1 Tax=Nocardia sichangensis TaxID=3385975 RepID=UPI0039A2E207